MRVLRSTLKTAGTSDRTLLPVIEWTLAGLEELHDFGRVVYFATRTNKPVLERARQAIDEFPCDLLFVPRDAERERHQDRVREIRDSLGESGLFFVPLVPVRMTEAWLLIDEDAIRRAADNPNGRQPLDLPPLQRLEQLPDPKETLDSLLIQVSGKSGRRAVKFKRELAWRRARVAAELIGDFAPLRSLHAFQEFERETKSAVASWLQSTRSP